MNALYRPVVSLLLALSGGAALAQQPALSAQVFTPDGRALISAGDDTTIRIWNVGTGEQQKPLAGPPRRLAGTHDADIRRLAFSADGRLFASASADRTVKIWNVVTGELQRTLSGHGNEVYGAAFSPDGALLASASWKAESDPFIVTGRIQATSATTSR